MRRHKTSALNPHASLGVESINWDLVSQANTLVTELYCHRGKKEGGATIATLPPLVAKPSFVSTPISKISFLFSKDVGIRVFHFQNLPWLIKKSPDQNIVSCWAGKCFRFISLPPAEFRGRRQVQLMVSASLLCEIRGGLFWRLSEMHLANLQFPKSHAPPMVQINKIYQACQLHLLKRLSSCVDNIKPWYFIPVFLWEAEDVLLGDDLVGEH